MKEEALKLADDLEVVVSHWEEDEKTAQQSADMIRKLVAELDKYQGYWKDCEKERTERCSDCQKQGEPVAWTDDLWTIHLNDEYCMLDEDMKKDMIPLYTTPQTKPLSMEEIESCMPNGYIPEFVPHNKWFKDFVRAIEERHGIK